MHRLLFEKKGNAVWISHLDLMRLFQRAFKRAGFSLTHTQGFNPRPSVSIALPLSVGTQSVCELLDFELDGVGVSCSEILHKLNQTLVDGIRVLDVYNEGKKIKELAYLDCMLRMEYDSGIPAGAVEQIRSLFDTDTLLVTKKSKNGMQEQNIIPMIKKLDISLDDNRHIILNARVCCQNPSLNPAQLLAAIENYLPDLKPDWCEITRLEILDHQETIFR